ncbi:response regulator transcription factor [Foetidibacter luteolus]|uniref:response regulator transcription factor n=1 Tax=Foetidibacter luteolus TaxID=2608880 RepID=UPI00129B3629|nr:response regulator transcription factor [Foetidibacter luteolus]
MINICIVDDHLLMAQSLKRLLASLDIACSIKLYQSAEEFLAGDYTNWKPDVILSDILLPGITGMELIDKSKHTGAKFILLTSVTDLNLIKEALAKGVSGYLTKDIPEEELAEAIQQALRGVQYINRSLKDRIVEQIFTAETANFNLSPRENQILQLICAGQTPKEIAGDMGLSIYTIQQYIKNIMRKFKVNRTTEMVVLAIKHGLYNPRLTKP